jgi:hypothetical protein
VYVAPFRYLDEKERAAVEARNRAAFRKTLDKICAALGRAKIAYQRKDYPKKQMEATVLQSGKNQSHRPPPTGSSS